jgi:hypothetical protein
MYCRYLYFLFGKPTFNLLFYVEVSASALPVPIVEQGLRQMAVLKLTDKDLPGPARFQDGVSHATLSHSDCTIVHAGLHIITVFLQCYGSVNISFGSGIRILLGHVGPIEKNVKYSTYH